MKKQLLHSTLQAMTGQGRRLWQMLIVMGAALCFSVAADATPWKNLYVQVEAYPAAGGTVYITSEDATPTLQPEVAASLVQAKYTLGENDKDKDELGYYAATVSAQPAEGYKFVGFAKKQVPAGREDYFYVARSEYRALSQTGEGKEYSININNADKAASNKQTGNEATDEERQADYEYCRNSEGTAWAFSATPDTYVYAIFAEVENPNPGEGEGGEDVNPGGGEDEGGEDVNPGEGEGDDGEEGEGGETVAPEPKPAYASVEYWQGASKTEGGETYFPGAQGENFGVITITGDNVEGGQITLTATPYAGITFDGWYDGPNGTKLNGSKATMTLTAAQPVYYAKFKKLSLTMDADKEWTTYSCSARTTSWKSGGMLPYIVTGINTAKAYVDTLQVTLSGSRCAYYVAENEGVLVRKGTATSVNPDYANSMWNQTANDWRHNLEYYGNVLCGTGAEDLLVPEDGKAYYTINAEGTAFTLIAAGGTIPALKAYLAVDNAEGTAPAELVIGKPEGVDDDPIVDPDDDEGEGEEGGEEGGEGGEPEPEPEPVAVTVDYWQGATEFSKQGENFGAISVSEAVVGGEVTLTATVNASTEFAGWFTEANGTEAISTDATVTLTAEAATYYAKFKKKGFGNNIKEPYNPMGYTAFSSPVRSTGWRTGYLAAYILTEAADNYVTLEEVSVQNGDYYIAENEGVIIAKGDKGMGISSNVFLYDADITNRTNCTAAGNLLTGTGLDAFTVPEDGNSYYVLTATDETMVFQLQNVGDVIPALSAYLVCEGEGADVLYIGKDNVPEPPVDDPDDPLTGISSVMASGNAAIYDLQGRKVNAQAKGVYIVGNKKVVVK